MISKRISCMCQTKNLEIMVFNMYQPIIFLSVALLVLIIFPHNIEGNVPSTDDKYKRLVLEARCTATCLSKVGTCSMKNNLLHDRSHFPCILLAKKFLMSFIFIFSLNEHEFCDRTQMYTYFTMR